MHIEMHVRTFKLANFFPGLYSRAQIQQGREREWGKGRGREKKRRGKGKGRRHDGRKGRKEGMGIRMGDCATAPRGDRRHWSQAATKQKNNTTLGKPYVF